MCTAVRIECACLEWTFTDPAGSKSMLRWSLAVRYLLKDTCAWEEQGYYCSRLHPTFLSSPFPRTRKVLLGVHALSVHWALMTLLMVVLPAKPNIVFHTHFPGLGRVTTAFLYKVQVHLNSRLVMKLGTYCEYTSSVNTKVCIAPHPVYVKQGLRLSQVGCRNTHNRVRRKGQTMLTV